MKPLSREWTADDRLRVVRALLPEMQNDIYAGMYSAPGRPNVTTLQGILNETPETLETYRRDFEAAVRAAEGEPS